VTRTGAAGEACFSLASAGREGAALDAEGAVDGVAGALSFAEALCLACSDPVEAGTRAASLTEVPE